MIEELDEDETPPTKEILKFIESYRKKVRDMLDLNSDGQEEESDYTPNGD